MPDDKDKPQVTLPSNSDGHSNDSDLKPSARLAQNPSAELNRAIMGGVSPAELARLGRLAQGPSEIIKKTAEGVLSGIRNKEAPNPIPVSRDQTWVDHGRSQDDLRRDITDAIEQTEKSAGSATMSNPESANRLHPQDKLFYVIIAWLTIPVTLIGGSIIAWLTGTLAGSLALSLVIIGLVGMAIGTSYALENRVLPSRYPSPVMIGIAALTWLLIGWQTWMVLHKPVQGYTQAQLDAAVSKATAPLQSQLNEAIKQRDANANELASIRGSNSQSSSPPPPPPTTSGPIEWKFDGQLVVTSWGSTGAVVSGLFFQGQSTKPLRFREAYVISGMTGHRVELKAAAGGEFPVTDVDVPADAPVQLDLVFTPPLPVRDFFDQWGRFRIVIAYEDGTTLQRDFDENFVREKVRRMAPDAFGPHVTPRQTSK